MRTFDEIYSIAADRKGGADELNTLLEPPADAKKLSRVGDDRWLAGMTKCIFRAGFNWKVVEAMWPGFEAAFDGFDVNRCAMLNDDDIDRLVTDKRIVRHGPKIRSVRENAVFLVDLARENGSAAKVFADWPGDDIIGLLAMLRKRASRLGGNTGQYFLRAMGKDGFILSKDVVARLIAEGVVDKNPSSKKDMAAVQDAFNDWRRQSGRSLKEISRLLAFSIG